MIHSYTVEGMTCSSCAEKVTRALENIEGVENAEVSNTNKTAIVTMAHHIDINELQKALDKEDPRYRISHQDVNRELIENTENGWLATYKPLLLVFGYIILVGLGIQLAEGSFDHMQWMRHFMGGFFLSFSFFKMLDLSSFADSYMGYDIIARRWRGWAYLYAFIELALGLAYILNFDQIITNAVAFTVMTVSIIGVLKAVINKQSIQCACLGTVFKLPMSTVTIIEDALMIVMSGYMLSQLI